MSSTEVLEVYIDFTSPAAYLAFDPLCALAKRCEVDIAWRPFRVRQGGIPETAPGEAASKGDTHRRVRALARRRTHTLYATLRGLPLNFPDTPRTGDLALACLLQAQRSMFRNTAAMTAFCAAAFTAFWAEGADLEDPQVIAGFGVTAPDDLSAMQSAFDAEEMRAREQFGIPDVPAIVVADQIFVGREHLPWVETLLGRASG